MKNRLKFAKNEVQIIFANGTESDFFETKEDALMALCDCFNQKRINQEELQIFTSQILESEEIFSLVEIIVKITLGVSQKRKRKVMFLENVRPEICECKNPIPHGRLIDAENDSVSQDFLTKAEAYFWAELLFEKKQISEKNFENLKVEISLLKIPESFQDN